MHHSIHHIRQAVFGPMISTAFLLFLALQTPGFAEERPPAEPTKPLFKRASASAPEAGEKSCNFDPPGPAVTAATPFSEALAKRKIFDGYSWKANGAPSSPVKIGVTFLSFELGKPYKNTVENVPGRGAMRLHAGAPPNVTIYTLKSKHMVCEQYRDGSVERRIVEGSYTCFISKDNEWTCPSDKDTKITPLK